MLHDEHADARTPSALPDPVHVRPVGPATVDRASAVALSADGVIVGRATLSRLYGARGELRLELAPTDAIALALVDALEGDARARGVAHLELDPGDLPDSVTEALRRSRPMHDEHRRTQVHLTWPTTNP